jgi:phenylacetate-CoA ligase
MIQAKFNNLPLQALVSRVGNDDVLKVRVEKISPEIGTPAWEEKFKTIFREICTVKIDQLEYLSAGVIKPEEKLIVDQRQW